MKQKKMFNFYKKIGYRMDDETTENFMWCVQRSNMCESESSKKNTAH